MKSKIQLILGTVIFISLFGCNGLNKTHVTERYYLVAVDVRENTSLGYSVNDDNSSFVDVVAECVYSVGFDDKYIIAKQHPANNREITNYFIVPIYKEFTYSPEKDVVGPLTLEQFNTQREEFGISNSVTFTTEIEDLK
ncbi:MAG TPA: hypothetical protein VF868_01445 [Bacteroidia bacterium]|jgi:hypothetical protein